MATYGGAIDLILTELSRNDTSITAYVEREFLKAVESYSTTRFWFNEARASFTASNTIYYPINTVIPADSTYAAGFVEIDQVSAVVNSGTYELPRETHQELERMDVSGFTGTPARFAIFGEKLRLYPKAATGTTYQLNVVGTRRLATLSASTESNAWTNEALNLISARVQKVYAAKKAKDVEAAQIFQLAEDEELARLMERTEKYLSAGRVKAGY